MFLLGWFHCFGADAPVAGVGFILAAIVLAIAGGTENWPFVPLLWGIKLAAAVIWYAVTIGPSFFLGLIPAAVLIIWGFFVILKRDLDGLFSER